MLDLNSCIFPESLSEVGTTTFRGQDFLSDSVKTSCVRVHSQQRPNQTKDSV